MSALEELMADRARAAAARFFLRAGRARGQRCGDEYSLPLFPLPLILEAEGLLAKPSELDTLSSCRESANAHQFFVPAAKS